MGDHMAVFRSLRELFPQVDTRILKAVAIEHQNDVDSAVVAVLDDVMPTMTGSVGASRTRHEAVASITDSIGTSSAIHVMRETGSSSSSGHDIHIDEVNGSVDSAQCTSSTEIITDTQENVVGEPDVGRPSLYQGTSEQLSCPAHPVPELNDNQCALTSDLIDSYLNPCSERKLVHSENEVGYLPDMNDVNDPFWAKIFAGVSNNEVSTGICSIEKGAFAPVLDFSIPDISESSVGPAGVLEQKDTKSDGIDCNKQQSGNIVENDDTLLSSKTDLLPDLNSNHFASMASTHSSHSVSIESLEDSIADAKNNKNDLLPSLELVTKMIEDVELLEEKAKVAKRESSVAGTGILTKVEELKEMLNHAKEANDMHAGEVFGEKSILTTEARELQSRLQRLSDERNSYLAVIEEIRQTLEERLVAAQQEIEAAEKEKVEKEASTLALLNEQEKEMNSIVEESIKLQKEAEENLKLKDFLVERGRIVDTLQGEMAVICDDVSQLKRIVDERLSWSKLQRSTISTLSSSLDKSGSSSDGTIEAVESTTDKHTVAEVASPVVEDPDGNERTVEVLDGSDITDKDNSKRRDSNEDGWEIC